MLAVVSVLGIVLTIATNRQAEATEDLTVIVERVENSLEYGRYERMVFQADQRKLVCLDLQDGDTGATSEQIAECAKEYTEPPPKPEGYDQ